jgi:hypothetical protein
VAVLIGAAVAYLQFTQQQQASHDLLISNQVSKGFEQLAGDKSAMRLGGIYALEGVMNTSDQYHQPVLEALCAFVRDNTTGKVSDKQPAADIQAALTVIARRKPGLGDVDLLGANTPTAILANAMLADANLSRANLRHANLRNANLSFAELSHAELSGADLGSALLTETILSGANLRGTDLRDADLVLAHLEGANLTDADLSNTKGLTQDQLNEACGKPKALPPGLTLDRPCPERPAT